MHATPSASSAGAAEIPGRGSAQWASAPWSTPAPPTATANQDLRFRDLLRGDGALVGAYVTAKRAILAAGTAVPNDYAVATGAFVERSGGAGSAAPNLAEDG